MKVYNKQGTVIQTLDTSKELARGGEGMVIDHGAEVAKIYLPGIQPITETKFVELQELSSNIFIKPKSLAYNQHGKIIGYFMNKVPADHFPILSLFNKTFCIRENVSDKTKINIIERLIDAMNFAHSKGIIIGDFNPYNILVNTQGSVFLIDVDSYGTKTVKHSGILFDEIRDYLYGGVVNLDSDYFSLSVIVFNMLTYVHPFKGIHKKVPKISERMLKKLPIFKVDPELFVPKCYLPITNPFLQEQFVDFYEIGKRFVINPKTISIIQATKKTLTIIAQQLKMYEILSGVQIIRTTCTSTRLAVTLADKTNIYSVYSKGLCTLMGSFPSQLGDKVFLAGNNTYVLRDKVFRLMEPDFIGYTVVKDFSQEPHIKINQFGNSLMIVTDTMKYEYNLTEIFGGIVQVKISNVFGGKFVNITSLFMRVDNSVILFYNKNKVTNSVILNNAIKDVYQVDDVGIIRYLEQDKLIYKYFKINGLQIELFDCSLDDFRRGDKLTPDLLIVPQDDELELIHTANMTVIAKYQCNVVSSDSVIHCCDAGIVIVNPSGIYLANKK